MRLRDRDGRLLLDQRGDGSRPEIARGSLRQLFPDALDPQCAGTCASPQSSAPALAFASTLRTAARTRPSSLIGADGTSSRVRPLLSDVQPRYTGVTFIEYRYLRADRALPRAAGSAGARLFFSLADERAIVATASPITSSASTPPQAS